MSYIKINGKQKHYHAKVQPFTTQHGYKGIRFVGDEIPTTDKGFKKYDDNGKVIADFSQYTCPYSPNCFSVEQDTIENPSGNFDPIGPSAFDNLSRRVSQLGAQVAQITPYEDKITAYYGEIEKTFYNVPQGNIAVYFDNYNGDYATQRLSDRVVITFAERLTDTTNITIMVLN